MAKNLKPEANDMVPKYGRFYPVSSKNNPANHEVPYHYVYPQTVMMYLMVSKQVDEKCCCTALQIMIFALIGHLRFTGCWKNENIKEITLLGQKSSKWNAA